MFRRRRRRSVGTLGSTAAVVLLGLAAIALVVFAVKHQRPQPRMTPSEQQALQAALTGTPTPMTRSTAAPSYTKLALPAHPNIAFFGDGWVAGDGVKPHTDGWTDQVAAALSGSARLEAAAGTGYVDPGAGTGDFSQRLGALQPSSPDLVVIEGGAADYEYNLSAYFGAAVRATITAAHAAFPKVPLVVVGPVTVAPEPTAYRAMDAILARICRARHVRYFSPLEQHWLPATADFGSATGYPSVTGYTLMARRFLDDLGYPHLTVPAVKGRTAPAVTATATSTTARAT